jgi:hypothetical protein
VYYGFVRGVSGERVGKKWKRKRRDGGGIIDDRHLCVVCVVCVCVLLMRERAGRRRVLRVQ